MEDLNMAMNLMEIIKGRRSIRSYIDKPVEKEKLEAVLEAARLAPSARNRQKWQFIVITDPAVKEVMAEACHNQPSVKQAPVCIVVVDEEPGVMSCGQPVDTVDASIAFSFLILKAHEEGLGTCWLGHFDKDKVKAGLGIPENMSVVAVTPLGYPAESPDARPRKALSEITRYDKY
jgi:nitroreductase